MTEEKPITEDVDDEVTIVIDEPEPEEITEVTAPVYPEAPEVEHGNPKQEHYRGARDPELAKSAKESSEK